MLTLIIVFNRSNCWYWSLRHTTSVSYTHLDVYKRQEGTIYVVSAKETNKNDAKAAITQLQRNGANILGTVLTKVEAEAKHYYGYYYNSES